LEKIVLLFLTIFFFGCQTRFEKEAENPLFEITNNQIITYNLNGNEMSRIPLKKYEKVILMTSAQAGFVKALHAENYVVGVSNKSYFYDSVFHRSQIQEFGDLERLRIEKLLLSKPDLVIFTPSLSISKYTNLLDKHQINWLIVNEYQESTPLRQAKWIHCFGAIFQKQALANQIFSDVELNYTKIKNTFENKKNKPLVLTGMPWQGKWHVSGKQSNFAQAIQDAGAIYFYDKNTENTYLDNEQILTKSKKTKFWIHLGIASSLLEAQNMFPMANQLPPFKNKKCYNNTVQKNKFGANNYWEMGVVYPDLVLEDLSQIFHNPNFEKGHFYEKLK
jgi:iron complex transport system substrate-binding protein